jgi:hypothetical protein
MQRTTLFCDICGRKFEDQTWEDTPQRILIETNCSCQNPMQAITKDGKFQYNCYAADEVCQKCMKVLAHTIADKIVELQIQKGK